MSWLVFSIALVACFLAQTTVLPLFFPVGDTVDMLLLLALVCGLALPAVDARLTGWVTGFVKDLDTDGPIGLHAFVFGLTVFVLTQLRELVNLHAGWVRWLVAFVVAFPAEILLGLHRRFVQGIELGVGPMLWRALVTAAVAAVLAAILTRLPVLLRRRRKRRTPAYRRV